MFFRESKKVLFCFVDQKNLAAKKVRENFLRRMGTESKSRNDGSGGGGSEGLSPAVKKVVQSVKEIVNCTEQEIYAVLKECDMDPNLAVEKLLAQGFSIIFHYCVFFRLRSFLQWSICFFSFTFFSWFYV